jgi:high-affinity Fe2+/Pb2+ permease
MFKIQNPEDLFPALVASLAVVGLVGSILTVVYLHKGGINVHFERTVIAFTCGTMFLASLVGVMMILMLTSY